MDDFEEIKNEELLTPEEDARIDAMLTQAADERNAEVDYDAMLAAIKRKASEDGLLVFSPEEKRQKSAPSRLMKRLSHIAMGIAAACVVGLGVAALVSKSGSDVGDRTANLPDITPQSDALTTAEPISSPSAWEQIDGTEGPFAVGTDTPKVSGGVDDPVPTAVPVRFNGHVETVRLTELGVITQNSQLITDGICAAVGNYEEYGRILRVRASAKGGVVCYDCTVIGFSPYETDIGYAEVEFRSASSFVVYWRVNANQYFLIHISGFDYNETVELLNTFVVA